MRGPARGEVVASQSACYLAAMEILRTPDEYFELLTGYPYEPHFQVLEVHGGLQMHYVDQGPRDARPLLLLHGQASWSYSYRHMISMCAEAGYRAIAPDLIGFGRSDKPGEGTDYSYSTHEAWLTTFVEELAIGDAILVCQDWGGLLGLRLVAAAPDRFAAVVAVNTCFPTGREELPATFAELRALAGTEGELPLPAMIERSVSGALDDEILAGYEAPFPQESLRAGARQLPLSFPTRPDDPEGLRNLELWESLAGYSRPFLTAFSDVDPVLLASASDFERRVAGAAGQRQTVLSGGGLLLQENRGSELARLVLELGLAL